MNIGVSVIAVALIAIFPLTSAAGPTIRDSPNQVDSIVWAQQQKISGSDAQAGDGIRVVLINGEKAFLGDPLATVGSNLGQGVVYTFEKSGTTWIQTQKIVLSTGAANDSFGGSLAYDPIGGLVIGAPGRRVGTNAGQGAAYTYQLSPISGWTQGQQLTASGGAANDHFGWKVAVSSSAIFSTAIGRQKNGQMGVGAAYIFQPSSGVWTQTQELGPTDSNADYFGGAIALNGTTAFIGAPLYYNGVDDIGAVFIYNRGTCIGGGYCWNLQQLIVPDEWSMSGTSSPYSIPPDADFGGPIATVGNLLMVGAAEATFGLWAVRNTGCVNVYTYSGGTWTPIARLTASDAHFNDLFGGGLDTDGSVALIGAPSTVRAGAVYSFELSGGVWTQQQKFQASDGFTDDGFGAPISLSGSNAMIGAVNATVGSNTDQGAAYWFSH